MDKFSGCRACILGLGVSGLSAAKLLQREGSQVVAVDDRLPSGVTEGVEVVSEVSMDRIDTLVVSPGVSPQHPLYVQARETGKSVIGEAALACQFFEGNPAVGITGTNGKTTVTLLVTHILNGCGKKACAIGNVGTPMTAQVPFDKEVVLVCELSSYQLETMSQPVFDAGLILNITPDHLDRYPSMSGYAEAKLRLGSCLKEGAPLYTGHHIEKLWRQNLRGVATHSFGDSGDFDTWSDGKSLFYQGQAFPLPENLTDIDNVIAAFVICRQLGLEATHILAAAATFQKPPHRLQHVIKVHGISFWDDSKATNIDAVIRAVKSLRGPVVLIAGGVHKGSSYTPWIEAFKGRVVHIVAIGQAASLIKEELGSEFSIEMADSMSEAVEYAIGVASHGGHVLLSPGCSSFDMFRNYSHRGEEFCKEVKLVACSAC